MKLIFGLGNAGAQYSGTRHNVGFAMLEALSSSHGVTFVKKDKFKADIAELSLAGEKLLLAKPHTFYNQVGESYRAIVDFYKIAPDETLVIHDELALPFGTVRVRAGGSDAGNNGIKSINQHGGVETMRLRIGVANERRTLIGDSDFVLGRFTQDEQEVLMRDIQSTVLSLVEDFSTGALTHTSHRHDL